MEFPDKRVLTLIDLRRSHNSMIEACVDSIESAMAAHETRVVDSVEICASLSEGGVTPSIGLVSIIRRSCPRFKNVRVLIRSRGGADFHFDPAEAEVMLEDVAAMAALPTSSRPTGFVFGALTASGEIDEGLLERIRSASRGFELTFHRAVDVGSQSPLEAARVLARHGVQRVLTSGKRTSAIEGFEAIQEMVSACRPLGIRVCAAGGVDLSNAAPLRRAADEIHGTFSRARRTRETRRPPVLVGMTSARTPTLESEYTIRTLSRETVLEISEKIASAASSRL